MKLLYLLEGMVAYGRGALRRGWRRWEQVSETILTWAEQTVDWITLSKDDRIPDPLRVLPAGTGALIFPNGESVPFNATAAEIAEAMNRTPAKDLPPWGDVIVRGEN